MDKPAVEISIEARRGCGYRKIGKDGYGLYLVGAGNFEPCERLPFPLTACPCCGAGIKFSRGFTWIKPEALFAPDLAPACHPDSSHHQHDHCPLCTPALAGERAGLMWVGDQFYSPDSFTREALTSGYISKKIAALPRGFVLGEHMIFLAHIHASATLVFGNGGIKPAPGVFMAWKPISLDIVVDTTDADKIPETARRIAESVGERARFVKVERAPELQPSQEVLFNG